MIQKVRVQTIVGPDLKGDGILNDIHRMLGIKNITRVSAIKVYRLEGISEKEAKILAEKLLSESINQRYTINSTSEESKPTSEVKSVIIEIAYKPGVMNPEVTSIIKAADDLGIKLPACDSSFEYAFYGSLKKAEVEKIVEKLKLYNSLIEHIVKDEPQTLILKGQPGKIQTIPIRSLNDQELRDLSKDQLFLNLEEMKKIQEYFAAEKRDPTDLELETLAQTWSEHSGHKTFKAELLVDGKKKEPLIDRLKKEALKHDKNIVSAFVDNSGVMDFYGGFGICGKVETHNAPSAIEPYGGAMTGSGGVFRDIAATGKGAKNIASTDIFCFAPIDLPASQLPAGCLPPEYLLKRVVSGVRDYGNRMGIPTNNGSVHFHKDFRARPTVIVGAYGIVPKKYAIKDKPERNDLIICVGGRTGRDGIHGATFSSGEMTADTYTTHSSAVQIGNAIEEKRMFDALLEARDQDLIRLVQDCGGGGFSSAIGEIGETLGVTVDIKNALLKYQGLAPWEIFLSESQERMIVVLDPKNLKVFEMICKKYNVESTVLGKFDGSKKLKVYFGGKVVGHLDMQFLHHGLPKRVLKASRQSSVVSRQIKEPIQPKSEEEWIKVLRKVLSHGNVCSKEPIVRLYDHLVQGTNDLQPYSGKNLDGPNDSPVLRPVLSKQYGMIISHGLNPVFNNIDPYWGSIWAATEALSNFVAVGGDYKNASLINNYIWPFPDQESLWSLDRSVDAVVDFMKIFKIPVISGKDSLSSTYRGADGSVIKIPPTLCISVLGKIEDTRKTVTADLKKVGSTIVLVGEMDKNLGGSVYHQVNNLETDSVPRIDLKLLPKTFDAIYKGIRNGQILSCHDISEGGVISAIFEMCVGGNCGVNIHLGGVTSSHLRGGRMGSSEVSELLFNETTGCFIVEVKDEKVAKQLFKNIPYITLGKTQKAPIIDVKNFFSAEVPNLKKVWQKPMKEMFS
ncbi:MAG: phosphoribosylformylglycinamidine synthase subunit PurL [Candidatus Daviesbacteria bacterium]|nr:phosphoribosylformylglycinamidine synthase subunit PurL [Candidatus Daviesbacteria bacterium]